MTKATVALSKHPRASKAQLVEEVGRLERRLNAVELLATERKRAEAALKESEELFRRSFEDAGVGAVMHHLDGRYRAVNGAFCRMLGYSEQELLAKNFTDVSLLEDIDVGRNLLRQMAAGERQTAEMEKRYMHKDGSVVWASVSGSVVRDAQGKALHTIAHIQNITERKRAEEQARKAQEQLNEALEAMAEGFVIFDNQDRLVQYNSKFAAMFPDLSELLESKPTFEEWARACAERGLMADAVGREDAWVAERVKQHNGDSQPNEFRLQGDRWIRLTEYKTKSGGIAGLRVDITEQKRAEEEIRKLNAELEQRVQSRTAELRLAQSELVRKERLATLGQLSATISHELRNPLGTIRNSLVLVDAKCRGRELGVEQEIERMNRNVSRCDSIISELLEFARVRAPIRKQKVLDTWLTEVLDELAVPPDVTVRRKLEAPKAIVAIDPGRLRRAVLNVYDNACQAMAEEPKNTGGEKKQELTVRTKATKGRFELTIADTGSGMPTEISDHAFEPLYSTKGFGVGLGLPIVKQIMEQHDGGIDIASRQGRGTLVVLWLPLWRAKTKKKIR